MIAYKLVRKLKDGSLSPLFINKRMRIKLGETYTAECHPTKGFAVRPGWHCTSKPIAPHLSERNRVWVKVDIQDWTVHNRPESQGGIWFTANKIKFIGEI